MIEVSKDSGREILDFKFKTQSMTTSKILPLKILCLLLYGYFKRVFVANNCVSNSCV